MQFTLIIINLFIQFIWQLDSQPIVEVSSLHRYAIGQYVDSSGDVISHLNITHVRPDDGGLYKCIASNSMGSAEFSTRLNVYGKSVQNSYVYICICSIIVEVYFYIFFIGFLCHSNAYYVLFSVIILALDSFIGTQISFPCVCYKFFQWRSQQIFFCFYNGQVRKNKKFLITIK